MPLATAPFKLDHHNLSADNNDPAGGPPHTFLAGYKINLV